jgi:glycosyltransferase involved in cell wall biosynthesis
MSYYHRKEQLDKTLESIHASEVNDYELIIVDDASPTPLVCDEARVIRVEPSEKWYHNPCIPYNRGFKEAKGDIVIIQNPECYHVGDVLAYARDRARKGLYLSFACYALNRNESWLLQHEGRMPKLADRMFKRPEDNGWYNHRQHRPVGFHFCSAIMKEDLEMLGGFDERYAGGVGYDDDDMAKRIQKIGMRIDIVQNPYVLHQFHMPFSYMADGMRELHQRNKQIYGATWQG